MMEAMATFLVKSSVWLTGFTCIYFLFLRNERFFMLNRAYLVSGIIVSLIFPFFTWRYTVLVPMVSNVEVGELQIQELTKVAEPFPFLQILLFLYFSGVAYLLYRVIRQTLPVFRIIREFRKQANPSANLIRTAGYPASFSFFSFVFVNPSISDIESNEILNHEQEHIRQQHWIDLILYEILRLMQWFNPVVWLYGHYLRQNHEFLADESALKKSLNPAIYRAALLNQMFDGPVISLANSFNYSINKKRFNMMKQKICSPIRKLKLLMVLPLIVVVFYAFSTPEYKFNSDGESSTGSNPLYIITKDQIDIQFTTQYTKADLESIKVELTKLGITIDYTLATFNEKGNLQEISASVKFPDGTGGSFVGRDLPSNPPGPAFKMKANGDFGFYNPRPVSGKVVTEDNQPLKAASVVVRGQSIGTTTDSDGFFKLRLTDEAPIIISFVGYKTIVVQPDFTKDMVIRLQKETILIGRNEATTPASATNPDGTPKKTVFFVVEEMPVYPGGPSALREFLSTNIQYPEQALKDSIQGKVFVNFVVSETGKVEEIKIMRGVNPLLDAEAIRVVSLLQDWTPGKQKDVNVAVSYTVPINFSLQKKGIQNNSPERFFNFNQGAGTQIRATGSLNNRTPLIVVDGKVGEITNLKDINPETIQSVNILKGEMGIQKYGEKAKDGVVEIITKNADATFTMVEEMPEFPGGVQALNMFISKSIVYPELSAKNGLQGKVFVSFIVGKDGSVKDARVVKSVSPLLDAEALRVIQQLPKWKPGKQGGEYVEVSYTIPVHFKLSDKIEPAADKNDMQIGNLLIVPNPASSEATITLEGSTTPTQLDMRIYDKTGSLLVQESKTGSTFLLSIQNLKTGTYLISVNDNLKRYSGWLKVIH